MNKPNNRLMIETALESERIETTPERINEITACFESIKPETMDKRLFKEFMEMWINFLIRKKYNG